MLTPTGSGSLGVFRPAIEHLMLRERILSAAILIPIVIFFFYLGGYWFLGLTLVAAMVAGYEYYHMLSVGGYNPSSPIGIAWLALLVLAGGWPGFPISFQAVVSLGIIITLSWSLWRQPRPAEDWGLTAAGAIYLGALASAFVALRELPHGFEWVLVAVLTTWITDSGAYFVGLSVGRHKLWPRLSPKKTWEGLVGGLVTGVIGATLLGVWLFPGVPWARWLALGVILSIVAPFGDLSVSMVKRQVGVKDTGHIIPGHGGVLDRLDSLLFLVPITYYWALWVGPC